MRKEFYSAGLIINVPKYYLTPSLMLRQLGFDVDMAEGKFRVPVDRWEALQFWNDSILSAKGGRVHARELGSLAGTMISMRLAWGPVTQLYSRHIYVPVRSVPYFNCWVVLSEEAGAGSFLGNNCRVFVSKRTFGRA